MPQTWQFPTIPPPDCSNYGSPGKLQFAAFTQFAAVLLNAEPVE
jgi:hypothetical protein